MCLPEGRREREGVIAGEKKKKKERCVLESVTGNSRNQPPPPPALPLLVPAAWEQNRPFPSGLLSYSWHGQFPFAKKIFSLIKEIRKSDE